MLRTFQLRQHLRSFFNFLLPPACALCLEPLTPPDPNSFCPGCRGQIPPLMDPRCRRCSVPYQAESGANHFCQTCLQEKIPLFDQVTSIGFYDGLLREAIHQFKYRNNINLDRPLAAMLAEQIQQANLTSDLIIPVPLHRDKLRQRTYNQSTLITRKLTSIIDTPYRLDLLARATPAPPQKGLSARERLQNVKGAFTLHGKLNGETVLLVDDVMTTGATIRACAKTLLAGGAGKVQIAILARAALR